MGQGKLGENIKSLRNTAGLTQRQLAEKLEISDRTLARWESGESRPDLEYIYKLARIFGVQPGRIVPPHRETEEEAYRRRRRMVNEPVRPVSPALNIVRSAVMFGVAPMLLQFFLPNNPRSSSWNSRLFYLGFSGLILLAAMLVFVYRERIDRWAKDGHEQDLNLRFYIAVILFRALAIGLAFLMYYQPYIYK